MILNSNYYLLSPTGGGLAAGGASGRAGAAPVVAPGSVLGRGVTSRIPVGAVGGEVRSVFWAVEVGGVVPA